MKTKTHFYFELWHSLKHLFIRIVAPNMLELIKLSNDLEETEDRHVC